MNEVQEMPQGTTNDICAEYKVPAKEEESTLLKSLLSNPVASTLIEQQKMITTTEVNDTQLNLKKILYQRDREREKDKDCEVSQHTATTAGTAHNEDPDDDRRLVIDISDEEATDNKYEKKSKLKSMPLLLDNSRFARILPKVPSSEQQHQHQPRTSTRFMTRIQQNHQQPKPFAHNLQPSSNNNIKIDILAIPSTVIHHQQDETTTTVDRRDMNHHQPSHLSSLSSFDELKIMSNEIDKQMTKKTNEIIILLKELLSGTLPTADFHAKMNGVGEISTSDLHSISRKLIKRHKFEHNPNQKDFMRMKSLQFPTNSKDLVNYFENLMPQLTKDKFLSMASFYEIIIKEMLNLNKTKMLQYLMDFMVLRKNPLLDLLNYNYLVNSSPNMKMPGTSSNHQVPDSTQSGSMTERRPPRPWDSCYNFTVRPSPIYLTSTTAAVTKHRDVINCRLSSRVQTRTFEKRPFDNNVLRGRRVGRRLVRSPAGEEAKASSKAEAVVRPVTQVRSTTPIVVESDTPPPSLPSETPSPPAQKLLKVPISEEATTTSKQQERPIRQPIKRRASVRALEFSQQISDGLNKQTSDSQISIAELNILSQNGTEVIPTILKHRIPSRRKTVDDRGVLSKALRVEEPKVSMELHSTFVQQPQQAIPQSSTYAPMKALKKRRQSCNERLLTQQTSQTMDDSDVIENVLIDERHPIAKTYIKCLQDYEQRLEELNSTHYQDQMRLQHHQRMIQENQTQPTKKVRFTIETNGDGHQTKEIQRMPFHLLQQQEQIQLQQQFESENQQRFIQQRSLMKQQQQQQHRHQHQQQQQQQQSGIDYNQYQLHFERTMRKLGFDPRSCSPNRPLELVAHSAPERYQQQQQPQPQQQQQQQPTEQYQYKKQQPMAPKIVRQASEKSPRNEAAFDVSPQNGEMSPAMLTAFKQLHQMDHTALTPQQYAEFLKQRDPQKFFPPSAFTMFRRSSSQQAQQHEEQQQQRAQPPPEAYYQQNGQATNYQQHAPPARISPHQYQISSTSQEPAQVISSGGNYIQHEQSLQRKLKMKTKSSKYVEPNQIPQPFYNPAHSTFYSEPYTMTQKKVVAVSSTAPTTPTAFNEHSQPTSPIRRIVHSPLQQQQQQQQYQQWLYAQSQMLQHNQVQQQQNVPNRPIAPRPMHPILFQAEPTEFLRQYYANMRP